MIHSYRTSIACPATFWENVTIQCVQALASSQLGALLQREECCIGKWHGVTSISVCHLSVWAGCSLLLLCCCFSKSIQATAKCNHTQKKTWKSWKAYRLVWVTAEVRKPKQGLQMWVTQHKVKTRAGLVPAPLLPCPLNPCIHTPLSAPLLILPLIRGHNNSQPPPSSSVLCNFIQNSEV